MENRRLFTRVLFSIKAILEVDDTNYPVSILDISLNGVLVTLPKSKQSFKNKEGTLSFSLLDGESEVVMQVIIVHEDDDEVGLQCHSIDIDSISHLRRLIELNLGDDEQINKELSQLTRSPD